MTPAAAKCQELKITLSHGDCSHCNGEYVRCGSTINDKPVYCQGGHSELSSKITYRGAKWVVIQQNDVVFFAPDNLNIPHTGWVSANPGAIRVPTFQFSCSDVLFDAIQINGANITLSERETVVLALLDTLHLSRSQIIMSDGDVTSDGRFYFTIDSRLTPSLTERLPRVLKEAIDDGTLLNFLTFRGLTQVTNVTHISIRLDAEDELALVPSPSSSPKPSHKPPEVLIPKRELPPIPPGRGAYDPSNCVPGSKWCEAVGRCIPSTSFCASIPALQPDGCEIETSETVEARLSQGENLVISIVDVPALQSQQAAK